MRKFKFDGRKVGRSLERLENEILAWANQELLRLETTQEWCDMDYFLFIRKVVSGAWFKSRYIPDACSGHLPEYLRSILYAYYAQHLITDYYKKWQSNKKPHI